MNSTEWQKIKELFNATVDLREEERARVLENCDEGLRFEVIKLLKANTEADEFIAEPALVDVGLRIEENANDFYVGKKIDAYEILREIGHGGMGTVYLASRADESFDKRVAVKLINRGMNTNAVLKRFVMERQILARLEHPNIALLLDGGSTDDGLPYFVMEYIEGLPVTKYCDAHNLNLKERLFLFQKICSAISYAHQNLIVHRDIKPSNILVTKDGTPKLLDFGIAKLLHPDWSADTNEATATILRAMTPEYASPEQLRGLPVTTASDVYSLGVVLYELLSGERPYKIESRLPEEVAREVLTQEPIKPSLVVNSKFKIQYSKSEDKTLPYEAKPTSDNQQKINRQSAIGNRQLSGDLDNIILKALQKESSRRYASVQEFSEDIRRHLEGLPVSATADTLSYRAAKFVKRHQAGVFAAALIALTLLSATIVTAWQARRANQERARAEYRFKQVRKLANTVLFDYHDGVEKLVGSTPLREKMVKDALEYLDNLSSESNNDAELQRELAAAYQKVGDVQGNPYMANLGDQKGALISYRKALAIRESLFALTPKDIQTRQNLALSYEKVGDVLWAQGDNTESQKSYRKALAICEELAIENNNFDTYNFVRLYNRIGYTQEQARDFSGAIESYQKSLSYMENLAAAEHANAKYKRGLAIGYIKIGDVLHLTKKFPESYEKFQKCLALFEELANADKSNATAQRDLTLALARIAATQAELGEYEKALETNSRTMALQEKLADADPNNLTIHFDIAATNANVANTFKMMGRYTESEREFRRTIATFKEYMAKNPDYSQPRSQLAEVYLMFAGMLLKNGNAANALENYRNSLAMLESEAMRNELPDKLAQGYEGVGDVHEFLSGNDLSKQAEHLRDAISYYQKSLDIFQNLKNNNKLGEENIKKPDEISEKISKCQSKLK